MKTGIYLMLASLVLLAGCVTRSISDTGYGNGGTYKGELTEMEVLGVSANAGIGEGDITAALNADHSFALHKGSRVLLLQSGAMMPDGELIAALRGEYEVVPVSGIPDRNGANPSYGRSYTNNGGTLAKRIDMALRLAAARADADTVIVVWGVLESAVKSHSTKAVSWVPIIGELVKDETQQMRIRLRAAVIDVASGSWEMIVPEPFSNDAESRRLNREFSDTMQILQLKEKAYGSLAQMLLQRFAPPDAPKNSPR